MESVKGKASRYLIDTHVLLWWLFDDPKLSGPAHDVIQAPDHAILVSSASGWEIATTETEIDEPIVIRLTGESVDDLVWGHLVLRVGRFAKATIVLSHSGSARYSATTSVLVGDGAKANVVSLQDWDDDAVHMGQQRDPGRA